MPSTKGTNRNTPAGCVLKFLFCVACSTRGTQISSLLQKQRSQRANTWSQESQRSRLQDNKSNKKTTGSRVFPPHVINTSIFTGPLFQMIFFKEVASSWQLNLWNWPLFIFFKGGEEKIQNKDKTKLLIIWSLNRGKINRSARRTITAWVYGRIR